MYIYSRAWDERDSVRNVEELFARDRTLEARGVRRMEAAMVACVEGWTGGVGGSEQPSRCGSRRCLAMPRVAVGLAQKRRRAHLPLSATSGVGPGEVRRRPGSGESRPLATVPLGADVGRPLRWREIWGSISGRK